jgi:hypothetical protein
VLWSLTAATTDAQPLITDVKPVILAGSYYDGSPDEDSPTKRVDPNTVDSPFGGVGSVCLGGVFRATAALIGPHEVLTAGHVVDLNNDGVVDVLPQELDFRLNLGGDLTHIIGVVQIAMHPDFTGFAHPVLNDDLAVLTLAHDAPPEAPIYELHKRPMRQGDALTLVGYGRSGWGNLGFRPPYETNSVKRWGQNVADMSFLDDEEGGFSEVYIFDFDGPDGTTNFVGGPSLGDEIETSLGFGDSGGPAFIWEDGAYRLAGVNTFIGRFTGLPFLPPLFGSAGGGAMVFPAGQWIASQAGLDWNVNVLKLNVLGGPAYLKPGQSVVLDMDALSLAQKVNGVQAFLNFSSSHFAVDSEHVSVVAGGGVWNELVYSLFNIQGNLDVAVGITFQLPGGTDADATTAIITLTATGEGTTSVVFRPSPHPDPGLTQTTCFASPDGSTVMPTKIDSQPIVIDGTSPVVGPISATENGIDIANEAAPVLPGIIQMALTASDPLAGLVSPPVVTMTLGTSTLPIAFAGESPTGTFNYTAEIGTDTPKGRWVLAATATDRAGNAATASTTINVAAINALTLNLPPASLYVRPGESVMIDMDVSNLLQKVNGCQALIGYNSQYLSSGNVAPGGGPWTELIYESWAVPGELDTAIGVQLEGGPDGTQADGTVAIITLTAGTVEGTTHLAFRADGEGGYATLLSGLNGQPVWPSKVDSAYITIDGTPPIITVDSAVEGAADVFMPGGATTTQGTVVISVSAADAFTGLTGPPTVGLANEAGTVTLTTTDTTSPFRYSWLVNPGTTNGTWSIVASAMDKAGNTAQDTGHFLIVNKNQISGSVSFATMSDSAYSFSRDVVFVATDAAGAVLETWAIPVGFTNDVGARTASGSYTLADVPGNPANLSARTACHLRKRQVVTLDADGQAVAAFTLLGGDLEGSNYVNILDYSILRSHWNSSDAAADINGDNQVQLFDYSIMKSNWFRIGDPE